jgi:hypothetical protein
MQKLKYATPIIVFETLSKQDVLCTSGEETGGHWAYIDKDDQTSNSTLDDDFW